MNLILKLLCETYHEKPACYRMTNDDLSCLLRGVDRVVENPRQRVLENQDRLDESHPVFPPLTSLQPNRQSGWPAFNL